MKKEKKSMIASAVLIAFSVFMLVYAIPTQIEVGSILGTSKSVDSRWFPNVVSAAILIIAVAEFVSSLVSYMKIRKAEQPDSENQEPKEKRPILSGEVRALVVFVLFLLYAIAFKFIGFIPSTIVFPAIVLFVMGGRKWYYYVSFYGVAAITYVLFVYVIGITIR